MAKIYIKFNAAIIKEIELTKDVTTFGRKSGNDIVIDHPTISGFHGKIVKDGEKYVVEDLNSTNGTFVHGQRIKSANIKDKDKIGVAGHIFEFYTGDGPSAEELKPEAPPPSTQNTASQKEMLRKVLELDKPKDAAATPALPPGTGVVKIVSGGVDGQTEVHLKELVTYIGTTDQATIKIKGFLAPSLAAAISRRQEGYFLKAVKAGYPKVNGTPVHEQVFLENGALIEAGGTNMVFYQSEKKPV
jgi:pSer/pThr/pTyr-binding forkhead associated (FHA) protein